MLIIIAGAIIDEQTRPISGRQARPNILAGSKAAFFMSRLERINFDCYSPTLLHRFFSQLRFVSTNRRTAALL